VPPRDSRQAPRYYDCAGFPLAASASRCIRQAISFEGSTSSNRCVSTRTARGLYGIIESSTWLELLRRRSVLMRDAREMTMGNPEFIRGPNSRMLWPANLSGSFAFILGGSTAANALIWLAAQIIPVTYKHGDGDFFFIILLLGFIHFLTVLALGERLMFIRLRRWLVLSFVAGVVSTAFVMGLLALAPTHWPPPTISAGGGVVLALTIIASSIGLTFWIFRRSLTPRA